MKNVHVATFEDSGKCKGYAWAEFEELSAAEAAVRGWADFYEDDDDDDDDDQAAAEREVEEIRKALSANEDDNYSNAEDDQEAEKKHYQALKPLAKTKIKKPKKPRKWWVNKLKGRPLRIEFAEGKEVRYKKRYGTGKKADDSSGFLATAAATKATAESIVETVAPTTTSSNAKPSAQTHQRSRPSKKNAMNNGTGGQTPQPRLTGGIVESKGKKVVLS